MQSTRLLYLDDSETLTGKTTVVAVGRSEKGAFFAGAETHFYPQGGGQQSDQGCIKLSGETIPVTFVGFSDGVVQHNIPDAYAGSISEGSEVSYEINDQRRIQNSRLHSAGHLISHVIEVMYPSMLPAKGYHFTDGPYIELLDEERLGYPEILEDICSMLYDSIEADHEISARMSDFAEVASLRPNLAPIIPKDKPTRIVTIGSYVPLPCGGTHVKSTAELAGLKVTRIKRKKEFLKVSYEFS